ncbi:MAG: hypothetical protein ACRD0B_09005 [Acidimicrobiales bacterium]
MPADFAELSSISGSLEQLAHRVAQMAESLDASGEPDSAAELFGVERALDAAGRRLRRLLEAAARGAS